MPPRAAPDAGTGHHPVGEGEGEVEKEGRRAGEGEREGGREGGREGERERGGRGGRATL